MTTLAKNKQLVYLFLCNFSILFIGFGLFPLLPLYAAEFGASAFGIGLYLALTYIAISIGSILAAQLSGRLPRRSLFIAAGLMGAPALVLLGQVQSFWQVILLTALVWFAGGVGLSISNVLTGLHTTSATRGNAFGMLALASPVSALIGGLVLGRLVERGGYPLMFTFLALVWTVWPVLAITRVEDKPDCAPAPGALSQPAATSLRPGPVFLLLLATVLLASMTVSVGRMGLSLAMKGQHFSVGEISAANAFGGLVTIPVTLLIGAFADKLGRKRILTLGYLVAMGGALMLIHARASWQFWIVSALVLASRNIITSMSPAYATDLLSRRSLGRALPLVGTMNWASGVVGFAGAGYVLDLFGAAGLYGGAALAGFSGALILAVMPASLRPRPAVEVPVAETKGSLQTTGD
jgi:YNFM family putative membrane transporter